MKAFKCFMAMTMVAVAVMNVEPLSAQTDRRKEQREAVRERAKSDKDLYAKSDKDIRKEAKRLEREGWKSMDLSIEKQLERTWERQWQTDEDGYEKFISKSAVVVAQNYNSALREAENVAKLGIASDMGAVVQSLATIALGNKEITPEQAASVSQSVEKVKLIVNERLGRVVTSMTLYKVTRNTYQVRVTVLYNRQEALKSARQAAMEELKEEMKVNEEEFDALFGYDKLRDEYAQTEWDETIE